MEMVDNNVDKSHEGDAIEKSSIVQVYCIQEGSDPSNEESSYKQSLGPQLGRQCPASGACPLKANIARHKAYMAVVMLQDASDMQEVQEKTTPLALMEIGDHKLV